MTVTVPPEGTRGSRFPRAVFRLVSRFAPGFFRRRPNTTAGGVPTLLLETRGAQTGKVRHAILGYLQDGPDAWLVIAALVGSSHHPGWLYNLAKQPRATIEFYGGRRVDVEAETLAGAERDEAWERLAKEAPEYVRYLDKTDREIPVIRLRQR